MILCLIIGISLFFDGCNLSVTDYCPQKLTEFHGHLYKKKVVKALCDSNVPCYKGYIFAQDQSNNKTCEFYVDNSAYKSNIKKKLLEYKNDQPMFWYQKYYSRQCIDRHGPIASWYTGVIFLVLGLAEFSYFAYIYKKRDFAKVNAEGEGGGEVAANIVTVFHNTDDTDSVL